MTRDSAYLAEIRPAWRRNWLESIAEFADYDLQRKSLLGGSEYSSPYWWYGEWMCRYFDDYCLSSGYERVINDGLVSRDEADAVQAFHAAADSYKPPRGDSNNHQAILADPAWQHVAELANAARLRLLTIVSAREEHDALQLHDG